MLALAGVRHKRRCRQIKKLLLLLEQVMAIQVSGEFLKMELKSLNKIYLGFFSENNLYMANNGSIKQFIVSKVNYDKKKILDYLQNGKKEAICPKPTYDIISGKMISTSFTVLTDGEYIWKNDLPYYVDKYNIKLPQSFIEKVIG